MPSYYLKWKKKTTATTTENINPRVSNTNNGKTMLLSKCAVCDSKKSRFIKKQEAKGILSSLSLKTPLSKFYYLVIFCFECSAAKCNSNDCIKWI